MSYRRIAVIASTLSLLIIVLVSGTGCNYTRHIPEGQHLLRSNSIKVRSNQNITRRGELKDNLEGLVSQKPNTYILWFPYKLWLYNQRYDKYQKDTSNFQLKSKTVEPPVIYDSSSKRRSVLNMKSYLFNQGYFYSTIDDTTTFKEKKAFVTYDVTTGPNYLINRGYYDISDSTINAIVHDAQQDTRLKPGLEFTYTLLEEERSRLIALLRNYGYYKLNNNNISFELDTATNRFAKDRDNAIESAIDFIALQKDKMKPTLDIKVTMRADDDPAAFYRYGVSRVRVFPDYRGGSDFRDSTMIVKTIGKTTFRYHDYYIRENIIYRHLFIEPDRYFSQKEYDLTVSKLNEMGAFQSIRISFTDDTAKGNNWLNANIFLTPADRFDFFSSLEGSTGNTYAAGSAVSVSVRNRNFARGGNMLTLTLNGGIEFTKDTIGNNFFNQFHLLTRSLGANASLDFPKFLVPFNIDKLSKRNIPRTELTLGTNLLDRVKYFTLINSSAGLKYKWRETSTKNWELSPAFANLIRLPNVTDSFERIRRNNTFLANTYKPTLIEGENVAFIFSNREEQAGRDYTYVRLGFEEAGGILKGINSFIPGLAGKYSQYVKFDFDVQHFILRPHSTVALRLYGGVGIPYDSSTTLPYIKQYYVGGAYSIRGWRVRTLGPGNYIDPAQVGNNVIDRTGDIKLEANAEYRFDVVQLFSGALRLKSAVFADAGNIWLAQPSPQYPEGDFKFERLGRSIAIASGLGARLDIAGFFLVRLDVGFPVKKPDYVHDYFANGSKITKGWVIDEMFNNRNWAKHNLVYNFAIGYPF